MNAETIWGIARAVVIGLLLGVLLIRLFEDRMVFFPNLFANDASAWNTRNYGLETEDVFLTTADGVRIHAWWATPPPEVGQGAEAPFTILYFHGNAGNLTNRIENVQFLLELPVNVLAVDYRSYGKSKGPFPTEEGVYRDAQAAYDYLVNERGVKPERLVVLGQSLGTAVAVDLAARNQVAALILEGGFPSARRVAQRVMKIPGLRFVIRSRYDSAAKLRSIHVPVLVAHCTRDPVLPFVMGEELYAAANPPRTFVRYEASCHEPLFLAALDDYHARLLTFLQSLGADESGQ